MSREASEFQLKIRIAMKSERAADAAMFATASPSVGGFDVEAKRNRKRSAFRGRGGLRFNCELLLPAEYGS